jgi:hypothetical protein
VWVKDTIKKRADRREERKGKKTESNVIKQKTKDKKQKSH